MDSKLGSARTEAVFLLQRDGNDDRYRLVMDYFGVFRIQNGVVKPPRKGGMARAYQGRTADELMSELAALEGKILRLAH